MFLLCFSKAFIFASRFPSFPLFTFQLLSWPDLYLNVTAFLPVPLGSKNSCPVVLSKPITKFETIE